MKFIKFLKLNLFLIFITTNVIADNNYFKEGQLLFDKKNYKEAKFKFEQDIVFNPKSEKSYLFLSKIYNKQKKKKLEEQNLKTVLLLNPKNEEATYNLSKLKLKESDYLESKKLIDQLLIFCVNYCIKSKKIKTEIEKSLKK